MGWDRRTRKARIPCATTNFAHVGRTTRWIDRKARPHLPIPRRPTIRPGCSALSVSRLSMSCATVRCRRVPTSPSAGNFPMRRTSPTTARRVRTTVPSPPPASGSFTTTRSGRRPFRPATRRDTFTTSISHTSRPGTTAAFSRRPPASTCRLTGCGRRSRRAPAFPTATATTSRAARSAPSCR